MKVNTKAIHYWLYDLTYSLWGGDAPEKTNLCQYVRRLAFAPLILVPLLFVMFLGTLVILVRAIAAYSLGYSTNWKTGNLQERSPGLFQIHGHQMYSGYLVLPIVLAGMNALFFKHLPPLHGTPVITVDQVSSVIFFTLEGVALVFGTIFGTFLFFSSDTWDLMTEWFDAKTEGVCPLVEFEGDDNGDQ